ncbi:alginate lyase family protein [Dyadobacter sp. 676]|uniref:Alginate lyase family protein n=1 Tax=Dyadobacter sp. 676 TaxID=3088362 RepID=A0AAU8FV15_9BACT
MKALRYLMLLGHISRQMGWRYVAFRAGYWLQGKTGMLKLRFPRNAISRCFINIEEWRDRKPAFLFERELLKIEKNAGNDDLKWRVAQIKAGKFRYFSHQWYEVHDWHTNALTGFVYPKSRHWSDVDDLSPKTGDIKYVWEKSRFAFLYDLIRYDYHFSEDQSETVFKLISDWIDSNPVNCGPNWKCGQEIALRVLNWTFALHYYRFSTTLNQVLLNKIVGSIYDQTRHVADNIRFSKIAVRNNHVLTEALGLFTVGSMFPFFSKSLKWKRGGKNLFEKEIISQIAPDGSYLQYSMNYHRVVVQLLTWGIRLSELHGDYMCEMVYARAKASLNFLRACQSNANGQLPNYGHNDGALFFLLTECKFRDFRPQMAALANVLGIDLGYQTGKWSEEGQWLAGCCRQFLIKISPRRISTFSGDGYYVIRNAGTLTFLRCGGYRSRPFQADHNHLDIWVNGRNILHDAGTWLYNADSESVSYFSGTRSHNTIMIENFDQMQKHYRFIWTHWIINAKGTAGFAGNAYWIEAGFEGFLHVGKGIVHRRRVVKKAGQLHWLVEDRVSNVPAGMRIRQLWHPDETFKDDFRIRATDDKGCEIPRIVGSGWYSEVYGQKIECAVVMFESEGSFIRTVIECCK